jgi:hypothetical protein
MRTQRIQTTMCRESSKRLLWLMEELFLSVCFDSFWVKLEELGLVAIWFEKAFFCFSRCSSTFFQARIVFDSAWMLRKCFRKLQCNRLLILFRFDFVFQHSSGIGAVPGASIVDVDPSSSLTFSRARMAESLERSK